MAIRSLFDMLFHPKEQHTLTQHFKIINGYTPAFTTWQGGVYEAELVRSAVDTGARAASKLIPTATGAAQPRAVRALRTSPNPQQTTAQWLARAYTMLTVDGTAYIVPLYDGNVLAGFALASRDAVRPYEYKGKVWYQVQSAAGEHLYVEGSRMGVLMRHQYRDDLHGDGGEPLRPTLDLMHAQAQAEQAAMRQGAAVRFLGRIGQSLKPSDVEKKRKQFNDNLSTDNAGGIAVYDSTFADVQQIQPQSYTIDAEQMQRIERSVYRYFNTCEALITSEYDEDTANAFYENVIEPFAIQLSEVLTRMIYTPYEISCGNSIQMLSNRLSYASHRTRLAIGRDLYNAGILSGNEVRDLFGLAHYPDGDRHIIRGEYIPLELIDQHTLGDAKGAAEFNANISTIDGYDDEEVSENADSES